MQPDGSGWRDALAVLKGPPSMLLIPTAALLVLSLMTSDTAAAAGFAVSSALFAGWFGSIFSDRLREGKELGRFKTRGKSAVRTLLFLNSELMAFEDTVRTFQERSTDYQGNPLLLQSDLEKVLSNCRSLEAGVHLSIADWEDFVPGSDERAKQVAENNELRRQLRSKDEALEAKDSELGSVAEQSNERIRQLNMELEQAKGQSESEEEIRTRLEKADAEASSRIAELRNERVILEAELADLKRRQSVVSSGLGPFSSYLLDSPSEHFTAPTVGVGHFIAPSVGGAALNYEIAGGQSRSETLTPGIQQTVPASQFQQPSPKTCSRCGKTFNGYLDFCDECARLPISIDPRSTGKK